MRWDQTLSQVLGTARLLPIPHRRRVVKRRDRPHLPQRLNPPNRLPQIRLAVPEPRLQIRPERNRRQALHPIIAPTQARPTTPIITVSPRIHHQKTTQITTKLRHRNRPQMPHSSLRLRHFVVSMGQFPSRTVPHKPLHKSSTHRMSRSLGHHPALNPPPRQRQVPN